MKKKIKDFTVAEIKNICRKYPNDCKGCPLENIMNFSKKDKNKCKKCPLYSISEIPCMTFCELLRNKQSLIEKIEKALDQELEVEDDVD